MRITTRAVWQMTADGGFELLERACFEYHGRLAQAFGGDSDSTTSSTTETNTQNLNLQGIEGVGLGNVEGNVRLEMTDEGTVAAARDIAITALDTGASGFNEAAGLASDALDAGVTQTRDVLDFAGDVQAGAFDFAGDTAAGFRESTENVTEDFLTFGEGLLSRVIDVVAGSGKAVVDATTAIQARESGNTDARLESITRYALIGGGLLAAAAIWSRK